MKIPLLPPLYLAAALLSIPSAAVADRGPPPPRFRELSPAPLTSLAPTAQGRLEAAQHALADALAALNRANGNRGPLLDPAISDVKAAGARVGDALNYVKAHPESNELAPGPAGEDSHRLTSIPSSSRVPGVNLLAAMEALNTALGQFLTNPQSHAVEGELGGFRAKIEDAIGQASSDVMAVISADNATATAAARAALPPAAAPIPPLAQPKATAAAVLDIVRATLLNTGFVGPNNAGNHAGMYSDLTALQRAAAIVARDDGSDLASSSRNNAMLARSLDAAINRAAAISVRPTETDQAKATSDQLHTQLVQTKNP